MTLPPECEQNNSLVICTYLTNDTFTVPAGVNNVTVQAWGGGGGGGGTLNLLGLGSSARGGGGGAFASSVLQLSSLSVHTVTVGEGGATSTDGGASSFGSEPLVRAAGGNGGESASIIGGEGAEGGTVAESIGNIRYAGGNGYAGGGGGAGTQGPGGTTTGNNGGQGAPVGGGNGGARPSAPLVGSAPGNPGLNFGGGGSGARNGTLSLGGVSEGGPGAPGRVIVTYNLPVIDAAESTIQADPETIPADGTSTAEITITLRYENGDQVPAGGEDLFLTTSAGTLSNGGVPVDHNDGTYTLTLTSSHVSDTAVVTAHLGTDSSGEMIGSAEVVFQFQPQTFFSRASGNWSDPSSWTFSSDHTGPEALSPPAPGDNVIIGGFGGTGHRIALSADTENDASVTVSGPGELDAGSFVLSGNGEFSLEEGALLMIGSAQGIDGEGASGNIQMTGGITYSPAASYSYKGSQAQSTGSGLPETINHLTVDNPDGVSALISHQITGVLNLEGGTFIMPSGSSLVVDHTGVNAAGGSVRMQKVIDGSKGWRMIASPLATTVSDLMDGFVTQGFSGSAFEQFQPNLLRFDETDAGTTLQGWRQPGSISEEIEGGRGYFHYLFDGAGRPDQSGSYDDALPVTLSATGLPYDFSGTQFDYGITYTPRDADDGQSGDRWTDINEADEGWNLIGNPVTATLDWDAASGWTRANVDNTIYLWDPSVNGGNGEYLVWNGVSGSLDSGLIAPFQGFWVRANGENPVLAFSDEAKSAGGVYVGSTAAKLSGITAKEEIPVLSLELRHGGMSTQSFISLMSEGQRGADRWDAYRLQPMGESWLALFTRSPEGGAPMVINNLPAGTEEEYVLPLHLDGSEEGRALEGAFTLRWELPEVWPGGLFATLMDHETERAISLHEQTEYTFSYRTRGPAAKSGAEPDQLNLPEALLMRVSDFDESAVTNAPAKGDAALLASAEDGHIRPSSRFTLLLSQSNRGESYLPDEVRLHQNYPNPFNPTTTISFTLPSESQVHLEIYDLLGRKVATLVNARLEAGSHQAVWDAGSHSSGIYLYRLITGQQVITQKMILLK